MIVLAVIGITGIMKVARGDSSMDLVTPESIVYTTLDVSSIPVGNNLMLKREISPFTVIVKELGLM